MITFSDVRVEETAVAVPRRVAAELLGALADAGAELADARWERELVAWLGDRRAAVAAGRLAGVDVGEIAWTPERFDAQQRFVLATFDRALARAPAWRHGELAALRALIAAHRREHVAVGRRWRWVVGPPPIPGPAGAGTDLEPRKSG